jgi:hypothetical protein
MTRQAWVARLAEQERSGLDIRSWCTREGVKVATFHYWKKRLKAAAQISPKLIALPMPMQALTEPSEAALELRTPHGYLIRLTQPHQIGWLGGVLEALR